MALPVSPAAVEMWGPVVLRAPPGTTVQPAVRVSAWQVPVVMAELAEQAGPVVVLVRQAVAEPVSPVVSEKIRLKVFLTKKAVTAVMRRGALRLQLVAVLQVKTRCRAVLLPMTTCFPSPPA